MCESPNIFSIWVGSYHKSPNFLTPPCRVIFYNNVFVDIYKGLFLGLVLLMGSGFRNVPLVVEPDSSRMTSPRYSCVWVYDVDCVVPFSLRCHLRLEIYNIKSSGQHVKIICLQCFCYVPLVVHS